jgi:hypothetical protein
MVSEQLAKGHQQIIKIAIIMFAFFVLIHFPHLFYEFDPMPEIRKVMLDNLFQQMPLCPGDCFQLRGVQYFRNWWIFHDSRIRFTGWKSFLTVP